MSGGGGAQKPLYIDIMHVRGDWVMMGAVQLPPPCTLSAADTSTSQWEERPSGGAIPRVPGWSQVASKQKSWHMSVGTPDRDTLE